MSTTTADAVATAIATRIKDIVPTLHAGDRFREITYEQPLRVFAQADLSGCRRRFSVLPGPDVTLPDVTDGLTEAVFQNFIVEVAYPTDWRYGDRGLRDLINVIDLDRQQIAKTVGTNGFASYASEPGSITVETIAESRDDLGTFHVGIVMLQARYFRSATP